MKKRWTKKEVEILKSNYSKMPRKELIRLLPDRSLGSVNVKARSLNLHGYKGNHSWHTKVFYNKNYFNEVIPESSYWAGFMAADAYIDNKNNKIRLKLSAKDKVQLETLAKCLRFSGQIREYCRDTNKGKSYPTVYIDLCGASKIISDLQKNFNIYSENKSFELQPPNLDTINSLAYLKGLIDGDGCITNNGLRFELLCTEAMANWCKRFFKQINYDICIRDYKRTKGLQIVYKQNLKLLYLLKSSTSLGLKRKWSQVPLVSNN